MPTFEYHWKKSMKLFGEDGAIYHHWIDQYASILGYNHRLMLHHDAGVQLGVLLFGENARKHLEQHIRDDLYSGEEEGQGQTAGTYEGVCSPETSENVSEISTEQSAVSGLSSSDISKCNLCDNPSVKKVNFCRECFDELIDIIMENSFGRALEEEKEMKK